MSAISFFPGGKATLRMAPLATLGVAAAALGSSATRMETGRCGRTAKFSPGTPASTAGFQQEACNAARVSSAIAADEAMSAAAKVVLGGFIGLAVAVAALVVSVVTNNPLALVGAALAVVGTSVIAGTAWPVRLPA